jgi:hypothetical protein
VLSSPMPKCVFGLAGSQKVGLAKLSNLDPVGLGHLRRSRQRSAAHDDFPVNLFTYEEALIGLSNLIKAAYSGENNEWRGIGNDLHAPSFSIESRSSSRSSKL